MRLFQSHPFHDISLVRGHECTVWDADGNAYTDMLSGVWCSILGHSHPRLVACVGEQVSKIAHVGVGFGSQEVEDAMSALSQILPAELNRVLFLNTGSEAVELGLKLARAATARDGIVVMQNGYYGATNYALSLSEAGRGAPYLTEPDGIIRLPFPDCSCCAYGKSTPCDEFCCVHSVEEHIRKTRARVAAVMYEPALGAGILVPPPGYATRLRRLASSLDALLIAEEVTTGMGRLGCWFGFMQDGVVPDILVVGKAIGAGLPVAAVITTDQIETLCKAVNLRHVQSHQNDPYSARIASTVISVIREECLLTRVDEIGRRLTTGLRLIAERVPHVREVRGKGAMIGIKLHESTPNLGSRIWSRLLEAGFITDLHAATGTIRLFPPYVLSEAEIDRFLDAFSAALRA